MEENRVPESPELKRAAIILGSIESVGTLIAFIGIARFSWLPFFGGLILEILGLIWGYFALGKEEERLNECERRKSNKNA